MKKFYLILLLITSAGATYANEDFQQPSTNYLYTPPPNINLNKDELNQLQKGNRIYKQVNANGQPRQAVVFRIDASKQKIWKTILNYSAYPEWIKNVDHAQIYRQDDHHYYVNFLIGHWYLGKFHYSVKHYLSDDSWMKWQLDKDRHSDFSLSIGYWQVIKAANDEGKHDVVYSADIQFREPRSEFIRKRSIKAGLKQASIWLPREAEK